MCLDSTRLDKEEEEEDSSMSLDQSELPPMQQPNYVESQHSIEFEMKPTVTLSELLAQFEKGEYTNFAGLKLALINPDGTVIPKDGLRTPVRKNQKVVYTQGGKKKTLKPDITGGDTLIQGIESTWIKNSELTFPTAAAFVLNTGDLPETSQPPYTRSIYLSTNSEIEGTSSSKYGAIITRDGQGQQIGPVELIWALERSWQKEV